jgi:hypothetical protein
MNILFQKIKINHLLNKRVLLLRFYIFGNPNSTITTNGIHYEQWKSCRQPIELHLFDFNHWLTLFHFWICYLVKQCPDSFSANGMRTE